MELSPLLSYLCLLQLTSIALASQPSNMDLNFNLRGGDNHLSRTRRSTAMIFHPPTGSCVLRKSLADPLKLGPCSRSDPWTYTPQRLLTIQGTYFCLQAVGPGKPVKLSVLCSPSESSQWEIETDSTTTTHLWTKLADGSTVCLDVNEDRSTITSNPCRSHGKAEAREYYDSQWFKMVAGHNKRSDAE